MKIIGLHKVSLIDFPGKIASVIFLGECNMKCPYCHNSDALSEECPSKISEQDFFQYLKERKSLIDGVCITGGEPTLHKELPDLIRKIRELGFKVKLDTNGSNPEMLKQLINDKLIDFASMDVKNVFEKYEETTSSKIDAKTIKESIRIIISSGLDHEFRTTVLPKLHKKEDMVRISKEYLTGAKKYVLQQFIPSEKILNKNYITEKRYTKEELEEIRKECNKYVKTEIRNL